MAHKRVQIMKMTIKITNNEMLNVIIVIIFIELIMCEFGTSSDIMFTLH